jgi:hypothetical protein
MYAIDCPHRTVTRQGAIDPAIVCPQLFTSPAPAAHRLGTLNIRRGLLLNNTDAG